MIGSTGYVLSVALTPRSDHLMSDHYSLGLLLVNSVHATFVRTRHDMGVQLAARRRAPYRSRRHPGRAHPGDLPVAVGSPLIPSAAGHPGRRLEQV